MSLNQAFAAIPQRQEFRLFQSVTLDGGAVSRPIEWPVAFCHGPEETVKEIEADAEVRVHEAFAVHAAMMNIVQPSGPEEPRAQQGNPSHPEVFDVHAVVQIAEHQDGPAQQSAQSGRLVDRRHAE